MTVACSLGFLVSALFVALGNSVGTAATILVSEGGASAFCVSLDEVEGGTLEFEGEEPGR